MFRCCSTSHVRCFPFAFLLNLHAGPQAKAAVEDKIRRMAVIPGIGMPRSMGASAAPPEAGPVGSAIPGRVDVMLASLKAAEGENKRIALERDDLRRQLEAAVAAAAAVAAVNVSPAASPAATPTSSPADMNSLQAAASAPAPGAGRALASGGGGSSASSHQLQKLRAEKGEVEAAAAQLRAENEQLRAAAAAAVARGAAVNDAEMKLALAQQEAERLRCGWMMGPAASFVVAAADRGLFLCACLALRMYSQCQVYGIPAVPSTNIRLSGVLMRLSQVRQCSAADQSGSDAAAAGGAAGCAGSSFQVRAGSRRSCCQSRSSGSCSSCIRGGRRHAPRRKC